MTKTPRKDPKQVKPKSKNKGGRPKGTIEVEFDDKIISHIQSLSGYGMTVERIASFVGVSKKTFERRVAEDPRVSDALSKGRAVAAATVTKTAFEMAVGGKFPAMTMFWLKCREQWKETKVHELTGKDGADLFSKDQMKKMAVEILEDEDDDTIDY